MINQGKEYWLIFKAGFVNPQIELLLAFVGTALAWFIKHILEVGMYLFIGVGGVFLNFALSLYIRYKFDERKIKDTIGFAVFRAFLYVVTVFIVHIADLYMLERWDLQLAYIFSSAFVGHELKIALGNWDKINDTNTFGFIKDKLDVLTKNKRKDENTGS